MAKPDYEMCDLIWREVSFCTRKRAAPTPTRFFRAKWDYYVDGKIDPRPVAWALNGYRVAGTECDTTSAAPKTDLLPGYGDLKADGSTACAMWIFSGFWSDDDAPLDPAQQPIGRRDNSDASGIGLNSTWAYAWPNNRRILYNRASADMAGKPWNPDKVLVEWTGDKWNLVDAADFVAPPTALPFRRTTRPSSCCGSRTAASRAMA